MKFYLFMLWVYVSAHLLVGAGFIIDKGTTILWFILWILGLIVIGHIFSVKETK